MQYFTEDGVIVEYAASPILFCCYNCSISQFVTPLRTVCCVHYSVCVLSYDGGTQLFDK